jgi:hypothetical protein
MLVDIFQRINWMYVLMIAILIRIVYIGVVNGFITEFYKLLGVLSACIFAFHYYPVIATAVHDRLPMFSLDNWQAFYFCVIWFVTVVIFRLIRDGLLMMFKVDAHPALDQWGGAILASKKFRPILSPNGSSCRWPRGFIPMSSGIVSGRYSPTSR